MSLYTLSKQESSPSEKLSIPVSIFLFSLSEVCESFLAKQIVAIVR